MQLNPAMAVWVERRPQKVIIGDEAQGGRVGNGRRCRSERRAVASFLIPSHVSPANRRPELTAAMEIASEDSDGANSGGGGAVVCKLAVLVFAKEMIAEAISLPLSDCSTPTIR